MQTMRVPLGSCKDLTGNRKGQFSCRLGKKLRLVIGPAKQPPPAQPDGGLEWAAVDAMPVLEVVNDHE